MNLNSITLLAVLIIACFVIAYGLPSTLVLAPLAAYVLGGASVLLVRACRRFPVCRMIAAALAGYQAAVIAAKLLVPPFDSVNWLVILLPAILAYAVFGGLFIKGWMAAFVENFRRRRHHRRTAARGRL